MEIKEIYSKILEHQIEGVMFHKQASEIMGFMNLKGLRKWQECRYIKENMNMYDTSKYCIYHQFSWLYNVALPYLEHAF